MQPAYLTSNMLQASIFLPFRRSFFSIRHPLTESVHHEKLDEFINGSIARLISQFHGNFALLRGKLNNYGVLCHHGTIISAESRVSSAVSILRRHVSRSSPI